MGLLAWSASAQADLPTLLLAVPTVDHEAVMDLGELSCLVIFLLVVVAGLATLRGWPSPVEVAPKHDALLKGGIILATLGFAAALLLMRCPVPAVSVTAFIGVAVSLGWADRKSTRLNSSHSGESRMPSSA